MEPDSPPKPVIVPTRDGYDRWAAIYDSEDNPLIADLPRAARYRGWPMLLLMRLRQK